MKNTCSPKPKYKNENLSGNFEIICTNIKSVGGLQGPEYIVFDHGMKFKVRYFIDGTVL